MIALDTSELHLALKSVIIFIHLIAKLRSSISITLLLNLDKMAKVPEFKHTMVLCAVHRELRRR
jgi:hypothetical protein